MFAAASPRSCVLIVDDNGAVASSFARVLERRGYLVEVVEHLDDALEMAAVYRFGTVLVRLDDLGRESTRVMRLTSLLDGPERVVVSVSRDDDSVGTWARKLGVRTISRRPTTADLLAAVSPVVALVRGA